MTTTRQRCRLCTCKLDPGEGDDTALLVCASCKARPEARRLGPPPAQGAAGAPARAFTPAERSLIAKMIRLVPATDLLALLNERVRADLGPDASPYTAAQLEAEIRIHAPQGVPVATKGAAGWSGLRRLLAQARRDGVLAQVNEQVIDDFAVLFSLSARQRANLKEVLLTQGDDDE